MLLIHISQQMQAFLLVRFYPEKELYVKIYPFQRKCVPIIELLLGAF